MRLPTNRNICLHIVLGNYQSWKKIERITLYSLYNRYYIISWTSRPQYVKVSRPPTFLVPVTPLVRGNHYHHMDYYRVFRNKIPSHSVVFFQILKKKQFILILSKNIHQLNRLKNHLKYAKLYL